MIKMDGFFIGVTKKIILTIIAVAITTFGTITYELYKSSGIGMLVTFVGLFLFFWTTFLYHPNIR